MTTTHPTAARPRGTLATLSVGTVLAAVAASMLQVAPAAANSGPNALTNTLTASQDVSGDRLPDLVAADTAGRLWVYPGNGRGGFRSRVAAGVGWEEMDEVHVAGNLDGAGGNDLIARKPSTGQLFLFPGNGRSGFGAGVEIGTEWNQVREIEAVGDVNGDRIPDLMALHAHDGNLLLYPGDGSGQLGGAHVAWTGLEEFVALTSMGDWNRDGSLDLSARHADGDLHVLYGEGNGVFVPSGSIRSGWGSKTALVGAADRNGDHKADVLARGRDGTMRLYAGNGRGGFAGVSAVAGNWNGIRLNPPVATTAPPEDPDQPTADEQRLLELVRDYRLWSGQDLPYLTDHPCLFEHDREHSAKMVADGQGLQHSTPESYAGCEVTGAQELIALGDTPEAIFEGWKADPATNAILLADDLPFVGIGSARSADGWYYTLSIAKPDVATPTITSPVDGSTITERSPVVTGTGTPRRSVHVTDEAGTTLGASVTDGLGNWSVPVQSLPDGENVLKAYLSYWGTDSPVPAVVRFTVAVPPGG